MQKRQENYQVDPKIEAILWKLYLAKNSDKAKHAWQNFISKPESQSQLEQVCEQLVNLCKRLIAYRLGINTEPETQEIAKIEMLYRDVFELILTARDRNFLEILLRSFAFRDKLKNCSAIATEELQQSVITAIQKALAETPQGVDDQPEEPAPAEPAPETVAPRSLAQWRYSPIADTFHPHSEYDTKFFKTPTPELKLIGARVRGKQHKHNGTNCDDWFELKVSGDWTITAVSDGAGSKELSRVGAKAACQGAVKYLGDELKYFKVAPLETEASLKLDDNFAFTDPDLLSAQNKLIGALKAAKSALIEKARELSDANQTVTEEDLSCTLLIAIHTTIKVNEKNYDFVLTSQVGDGVLAAISQAGTLKLLGQPERGDFGSETKFLSSNLDESHLRRNICYFIGNLKTLLIMTDGVSEDYFPYDQRMLELYGDLAVNNIIKISQPQMTTINEKLTTTNVASLDALQSLKHLFQEEVVRILPENSTEPKNLMIASVAKYAETLGTSVAEIANSPALLAAGMLQDKRNSFPEDKLRLWLDSYYRRGSFDDRTLVVLYREEV